MEEEGECFFKKVKNLNAAVKIKKNYLFIITRRQA